MSSNKGELVFVPTPAMGHLLSIVQLAKVLVERNQHVSVAIYIINLPTISPKIKAFVESQSRDNPYSTRLTYVTLPPLSNQPTSSFSSNFFSTVIELYKPVIKQVVEDRARSGFPKPAGFILDIFCTPIIDVANDLELPSYIFLTSGAYVLNLMYFALSMAEDQGIDDVASKFREPGLSFSVPGFNNRLETKFIPAIFQDKENDIIIRNFAKRSKEARGILMNTYTELESSAIQALMDNSHNDVPTIYPVGPFLELDHNSGSGGSHDEEHKSIMEWLDDQPKSSVVFLCFGSMGSFDEEQIKEIAHGLDQSGHRFLWALRRPPPQGKLGPGDSESFLEALPDGFVDRTAHRGKIIGWAPQVQILAHHAVGGFVTHCGWNSILESLWFGVPMAAWPLYAEQQLNAFTMVKESGLAVEIRIDYKRDLKTKAGNFLVTAKDVEIGVTNLMTMDGDMRGRVEKMSDKARQALKSGGSSYDSLNHFVTGVLSNVN